MTKQAAGVRQFQGEGEPFLWCERAHRVEPSGFQPSAQLARPARAIQHIRGERFFHVAIIHGYTQEANGVMTLLEMPLEIARLEDTAFSNDTGDQVGRRHIKGRIVHIDP